MREIKYKNELNLPEWVQKRKITLTEVDFYLKNITFINIDIYLLFESLRIISLNYLWNITEFLKK